MHRAFRRISPDLAVASGRFSRYNLGKRPDEGVTLVETDGSMNALDALLQATGARHAHLCPKQVLGVRMGLLAGELVEIDVPQRDRRLLVIMETDGCFADGVSVATGCSIGHRTLRVEDFGKVAATFADTQSERAVRIVPRPEARSRATHYAENGLSRWQSQLLGYQQMPDALLFRVQEVRLITPVAAYVSRPHARSLCHDCREEIINEREVLRDGVVLCRACAGNAYYLNGPRTSEVSGSQDVQVSKALTDA